MYLQFYFCKFVAKPWGL